MHNRHQHENTMISPVLYHVSFRGGSKITTGIQIRLHAGGASPLQCVCWFLRYKVSLNKYARTLGIMKQITGHYLLIIRS